MNEYSAGILATGSYVPKEEIDNEDLARRIGTTGAWIQRETGIRTRRYAAPDEAASDLAARAADRALAQAGSTADQVDYLVVCTTTGDFPQPPTSHLVQNSIGAHQAACFDVGVACSGFVYGLELVRGLLRLREGGLALVISTEVHSRFTDASDRRAAALLGDGAAAVLVGPVPPGHGFINTDLSSHGDAHMPMQIKAGGSRVPPSHESVDGGGHVVTMDSPGARDFAMASLPPVLTKLTQAAGYRMDQVDHFLPHQADGIPPQKLARELGLRNAVSHSTVARYGHVGSASVPLTLDHANRAGQLHDGDLILMAGFGGGISMGAALLRWAVTF